MERHKRIYQASLAGVVLNVALVIMKAIVGVMSGSASVMTDAVNNLTDALSATVALVGTKLAQKKPDREHPHGHGRIEYIAATVIGVIIFGVGVGAVTNNAPLIFAPKMAVYSTVTLVVIALAVVMKLVYARYVEKIGRETKSRSLTATGTDAMFDALLSFGTLVGAGVNMVLGVSIEGWIGVIIAAFIIRSGVEIIREGVSDVIGKRVDERLYRKLREKIKELPKVENVKTLVLHDYGPTELTGTVKIEVAEMKVSEFRELAEKIEAMAKDEFGVKLAVGVA